MDQQQRSLTHEQRLKSEVSRGLEQVRQLEHKIQSIESPALYPSLISDAASIISTFISVIQHLNHASRTNSVASPICSTRLATPPHSPSPHTTSSSSPAEGSPAAATNTPCSIPVSLSLEPAAAASVSASAENDRSAETTGMDQHELLFPTDWRSNRKRKSMPKRVTKLPANTNEHGGEAPAEDGFTWRKYGQKDILNSKFPRSYYRCTHQKEMGCQATKYVQKCEDDSSMYQVTYIGEHTCQNVQQQTSLWTSSKAARPLLDSPFMTGSSSLFSSRLEDMKAARLSLSPSRSTSATMGFNLLRPNSTLVTSPSQWLTPKFGGLACPIKPEPLSTPPPQLTTQPSPKDKDKPLLKMSLASGTQAQGEPENQNELGFWNLEDLGLEQKVVMDDTSELAVSGSLEHIPKSSLTEDIPWEPMLFE